MGKGANLILSVDGKEVAKGRTERTIGARLSLDETWDVGEDTGTPVEFNVYDVPYKFDGGLKKLTVTYKEFNCNFYNGHPLIKIGMDDCYFQVC